MGFSIFTGGFQYSCMCRLSVWVIWYASWRLICLPCFLRLGLCGEKGCKWFLRRAPGRRSAVHIHSVDGSGVDIAADAKTQAQYALRGCPLRQGVFQTALSSGMGVINYHKLGLGWVKYLNVRCIYACLFVCRCLQRPGLDTRNKESEKIRNIVMAPICAGFAARIRCAMHASHVRPQERQGNMGGPPIRVWQSAYRRWRSTRPV